MITLKSIWEWVKKNKIISIFITILIILLAILTVGIIFFVIWLGIYMYNRTKKEYYDDKVTEYYNKINTMSIDEIIKELDIKFAKIVKTDTLIKAHKIRKKNIKNPLSYLKNEPEYSSLIFDIDKTYNELMENIDINIDKYDLEDAVFTLDIISKKEYIDYNIYYMLALNKSSLILKDKVDKELFDIIAIFPDIIRLSIYINLYNADLLNVNQIIHISKYYKKLDSVYKLYKNNISHRLYENIQKYIKKIIDVYMRIK